MRKKFIYTLWVLVVLGILAVAMVFTAIAKGWIGYVPPVEELENPNLKFATQIISDDGELLAYPMTGNCLAHGRIAKKTAFM